MKSTYKLLGVIWDNLETTNNIDKIKSLDNIDNYYIINVSNLFELESKDDLATIIDSISTYKNILIHKDYTPRTVNPIINDFYTKRFNQIYTFLKRNIPNSNIYVINDI